MAIIVFISQSLCVDLIHKAAIAGGLSGGVFFHACVGEQACSDYNGAGN